MTWYGQPGIESWINGSELDDTIEASSRYLTAEEITLYRMDKKSRFSYSFKFDHIEPSQMVEIKKSIVEARLKVGSSLASIAGSELDYERLNKQQEILIEDVDGWGLRMLREDEGGKFIQGGFAVGEELPDEVYESLPYVFVSVLASTGTFAGITIPREVHLNKARDRVINTPEFCRENEDRFTAYAIKGIARILAEGKLNEGFLPYDFQERFLQRHALSSEEQLKAVQSLGRGEIPDLQWIRDSENQTREVMTLVMNLPLVNLKGSEEKYSIMELMVINAGANYLLNESVKDHKTVHEIIGSLVAEEDGELYLTNKAIETMQRNNELRQKIANRFEHVLQRTRGNIPLPARNFLQKVRDRASKMSRVKTIASGATGAVLGTVGTALFNIMSNPTVSHTAQQVATGYIPKTYLYESIGYGAFILLTAGVGTVRVVRRIRERNNNYEFVITAEEEGESSNGHSSRRGSRFSEQSERSDDSNLHESVIVPEEESKSSNGHSSRRGSRSSEQSDRSHYEVAEVDEKEAQRIIRVHGKNILEAAQQAVQLANEADDAEVHPILTIRSGDELGPGTTVHGAIAKLSASIVNLAHPEAMFAKSNVGFYLEETPTSLARGGGNVIGFNLNQATFAAARQAVLTNDPITFLQDVAPVVIHEAQHARESDFKPDEPEQDTHDRTFAVGVYEGFGRFMNMALRPVDSPDDELVIEQLVREAYSSCNRGEPVKPAREFYSALEAQNT
jgi:hypothetical protein